MGTSCGDALYAKHAVLGGSLVFHRVPVTGGINLSCARAMTLDDDIEKPGRVGGLRRVLPVNLGPWRGAPVGKPRKLARRRAGSARRLRLQRLRSDESSDSRSRRAWLQQTCPFQQSAWQQLIDVYRERGRHGDANRTAIAMHNDRLKWGFLGTGAPAAGPSG